MSTPDLRIDSLHLQNFRCFPHCDIAFHPSLTVLVAENGQGKSAVLDAVSIALGPVLDVITGTKFKRDFQASDVHLLRHDDGGMKAAPETSFEAEGSIAESSVTWSRSLNTLSDRSRSTTKGLKRVRSVATSLRDRLASLDSSSVMPLIALYGTGRLCNEDDTAKAGTKGRIDDRSRLAGYVNCFSPNSSFALFSQWFETSFREIGDPIYASEVFGRIALVDVVKDAVRKVLRPSGWQELNWDPLQATLIVEHSQLGRLPLSLLSDGVRNMVSLVADIAHRCVRLNPQLEGEATSRTPGILLIDEVDMHLHPRWQQVVIGLLQQAFPQLQMIVTTHSPHVLSAVHNKSIRVIRLQNRDTSIETPQFQTRGVMSADVLATIMHVDPIPQIPEAEDLSRYRSLIEDGMSDNKDANVLRQRLISHFGEMHPVIIECNRLIRFQKFRLKRKNTEEGA